MEFKFDNYLLKFAFALPGILMFGMVMCGAVSGHWELFIASSPFIVALMPGYWRLLPRGGLRHGHGCDCPEPDAVCELGFWFEIGQRIFLFLPPLLLSVFLGSIFPMRHNLIEAVIETSLATLTAIIFS